MRVGVPDRRCRGVRDDKESGGPSKRCISPDSGIYIASMGRIITYLRAHSWLTVVVVIGLLLCGGLGVWLQPREPQLPAYEHLQANAGDYYPGGASCKPPEIARFPVGGRQGKRDACADRAEEHRLIENDLLQQRRAADAAQALVPLAYQQSSVLLWGLLFGVTTLLAAICAAKFAGDAAHAARAALNTDRARVFFKEVAPRISPEGDAGEFKLWFSNFGRTPALDTSVEQRYDFAMRGEPVPQIPLKGEPPADSIIPPDQRVAGPNITLRGARFRAWLAGEEILYVRVRVIYGDVFNLGHPPHETEAGLMIECLGMQVGIHGGPEPNMRVSTLLGWSRGT